MFDMLAGPTVWLRFEDAVVPRRSSEIQEKHNKLSLKVCVLDHQVFEGN